jgi:hypothetical protein
MIKIVVTGAENNAVFQNLRTEKNNLSQKTDTLPAGPAVKGFSRFFVRSVHDRPVSKKFRKLSE